MSKLSSFIRSLRIKKIEYDIIISGRPPFRMATLASDQVIGRTIREQGRWQENHIIDVVKWLDMTVKGKTFVDIGANIGTHSIAALNYGFAHAICIEPDPTNFMLLKINQILNSVEGRCQNFNMAASNSIGQLMFELNERNPGDHRVRVAGLDKIQGVTSASKRFLNVPSMPLDQILATASVSIGDIGLVWIDTQGHEGHVLTSANSLLTSGVPIVLEFWPFGLNQADGYRLLRPVLARSKLYDVRNINSSNSPLGMAHVDQMFSGWVDDESEHTDFLLLPN
jgi:FkbM family methyltransferase